MSLEVSLLSTLVEGPVSLGWFHRLQNNGEPWYFWIIKQTNGEPWYFWIIKRTNGEPVDVFFPFCTIVPFWCTLLCVVGSFIFKWYTFSLFSFAVPSFPQWFPPSTTCFSAFFTRSQQKELTQATRFVTRTFPVWLRVVCETCSYSDTSTNVQC